MLDDQHNVREGLFENPLPNSVPCIVLSMPVSDTLLEE